MDKRKSPKADLENKQLLFVEIGLIVALSVSLFAFEYKKYDIKKVSITTREVREVMEEVVLQTKQEEIKAPPKPATIMSSSTLFNIVENKVDVQSTIVIDAGADEKTEIDVYVPLEIEEEKIQEQQEIFLVVEKQPEFPGGEAARLEYLMQNIKYPQLAKESGIQGKVYVQFVVEPSGSVSNVKVVRGIGGGCDEEAVRVIKNMPKWTPGEQRGRKVRVQYSMPITFTLRST